MNRRLLVFFLVILTLSIISILYNPHPTAQVTKQTDYPLEEAVLLRVVDGDTIEARVNNEAWKIRLLGINSPEKKMPFSSEAANFLKQFLNQTIEIQRDFEDTDKYHRKLRYAFYNDVLLEEEILKRGFANSYYTSGLKYENQLLSAENQARAEGTGIWTLSSEECAVKKCINLEELNAEKEYFTIKNSCGFSCDLGGWFVKDAGRNTFYLSALNSEEEKTYNSKNNTEVWNNNGDRFFMFDEKGLLVLYSEY